MDDEQVRKRLDALAERVSRFGVKLLYGIGLLLAFITAFEGRHYYSAWGYNRAPFEYSTAMYCFNTAWLAFMSFWITRYLRSQGNTETRRPWLWFVASAAFAAAGYIQGLSIHERLAPFLEKKFPGIRLLVMTNIDSLFLISVGICAAIFTLFFLRELKVVPKARRFYLAGLGLILLAGCIDYFPERIWHGLFPRGLEELSEHFAGLSFTAAFLLYTLDRAKLALSEWLTVK